MGKASVPTQAFALIGVAAVAAGIHSLVVPINLAREGGGGFTVPMSRGGAVEPGVSPDAPVAEPGGDGDGIAGGPGGADAPVESAEASGKIGLEKAAELHELAMMGEMILFLDARLRSDYEAGHIAGALHMPFTRLGEAEGIDAIMNLAPPGDGTLMVIYCTGGECEASEDTAIRLEELGYDNIAIMADGYTDWAAAGLPTGSVGGSGGGEP